MAAAATGYNIAAHLAAMAAAANFFAGDNSNQGKYAVKLVYALFRAIKPGNHFLYISF